MGGIERQELAAQFERTALCRRLRARYDELGNRLAMAVRRMDEQPLDEAATASAVQTAQARSEILAQIERSRDELVELADWFAAMTRPTPRIEAALRHFTAGAYLAARIGMDYDRMISELDASPALCIDGLNRPEATDGAEALADEFVILAYLLALDEDRVEHTDTITDCFERSLGAAPSPHRAVAYAGFLRRQGCIAQADIWLEEAWSLARRPGAGGRPFSLACQAALLRDLTAARLQAIELESASETCHAGLECYRKLVAEDPTTHSPGFASMLHLAAGLAQHQGVLAQAERYYREALDIRRSLAALRPEAPRTDLGRVLNDLGVLLLGAGRLAEAELPLVQAVEAYRAELWTRPGIVAIPLAMTLNNLGLLLRETDDAAGGVKCCEEALTIYRAFGDREATLHRHGLGATLNNLALLRQELGKPVDAFAAFAEALELRRGLALGDPDRYGTDAAVTALNMSILHLESVPDEALSVELARDALRLALPRVDRHPQARQCVAVAREVLARWSRAPRSA